MARDHEVHAKIRNLTEKEAGRLEAAIVNARVRIAPKAHGKIIAGNPKASIGNVIKKALGSGD